MVDVAGAVSCRPAEFESVDAVAQLGNLHPLHDEHAEHDEHVAGADAPQRCRQESAADLVVPRRSNVRPMLRLEIRVGGTGS
jgi:hypothetical protein